MLIAAYHRMKHSLSNLEKKLGTTFENQDILRQAMVHRSYLNEHKDFELGHNERLEFLGDAVLELIITELLFNAYGNPEGELTNWRAALVNAKMLSDIAKEIGIEPFLYLSRGEAQEAGTKARDYILANAMEAIIGAVYIDQGYRGAKKIVSKWVWSKIDAVLEQGLWMDPKSRFQEAAQERVGVTPTYKVLEERGPDHAKHFSIGVYLSRELIATGAGTSKQEAQVSAAEAALQAKAWKGPTVHIVVRKKGDPI